MTRIGFTGTRERLTHWQISAVQDILRIHATGQAIEVHHGDCVGADAMVHALAMQEKNSFIVVHPPTDEKLRARCTGERSKVTVLDPLPYLERNAAIVDACEIVIALPKEEVEQQRSGTWATARHALKQHRRLMLVHPGGISRWVDDLSDLSRRPRI